MKNVTQKVRFLKFIRFHTILITIFAAFLLLKDNLWFKQEMPDKNFISLIMTRTHMDQCIDTGCIGEYTIQDLGMATASGLAIGTISNKTYILTANHFCNSEQYSLGMSPLDGYIISKIHVSDVDGNLWSSKIVYADLKSDLCLIESEMSAVNSIRLSSTMPAVGEKVFALSAPGSIAMKEVGLHLEGYFSGCDYQNMCYYTIPSTFGSSGSVILNRKRQIIGMIQMSPRDFNFTSIGVGLVAMKRFLENASSDLKIDLINWSVQ